MRFTGGQMGMFGEIFDSVGVYDSGMECADGVIEMEFLGLRAYVFKDRLTG